MTNYNYVDKYNRHILTTNSDVGLDLHHERIPVKMLETFVQDALPYIEQLGLLLSVLPKEEQVNEKIISSIVLSALYDFAKHELQKHPLHKKDSFDPFILKHYAMGGLNEYPANTYDILVDECKRLMEIKRKATGTESIEKLKVSMSAIRITMDIISLHFKRNEQELIAHDKLKLIVNILCKHKIHTKDDFSALICDLLMYVIDTRLLGTF